MTTSLERGSRRAFVDTSAYYALIDRRDANHSPAQSIATRLTTERYQQFTTDFVLAELHALLLARLGRGIAGRVLRDMDRSSTIITPVTTRDQRRAREILQQYDDKDFSLTDALSFAVMERLAIPNAFTFDHHFAQYGLSVLTSQ